MAQADESHQRRRRPDGLAESLRQRTQTWHVTAEKTGIVSELLHGRATAYGYAMLLRNLLPAYQAMENALDRRRHAPGVRAVARPELYRSAALESDLVGLCGETWPTKLPLVPAAERYAERSAAAEDGARLVAHAYVRYLGDLSGGQILARLLGRSLALGPECLAFYDFPAIADVPAYKAAFREAIDAALPEIDDVESVLDEAVEVFRLNIAVSEEVAANVASRSGMALLAS